MGSRYGEHPISLSETVVCLNQKLRLTVSGRLVEVENLGRTVSPPLIVVPTPPSFGGSRSDT